MQTRSTLQAATGRHSAFRLGPDHGYAFDGDQVRLNAEIVGEIPADQALSLQLWACDVHFDGRPVGGTKVADVPLAADQGRVEVVAPAFPPAGQTAHAMALVLADGASGRVVDFASFPRWQHFSQPRLLGTAGFALVDDKLRVTVDGIDNPRPADNLSGTLSLELWALPAPYAARGLDGGTHLAGVNLGALDGQQSWSALAFDLAVGAHPAGTWYVALLLREWTAAGYVTRDFTDFPVPVTWNAELVAPPAVEPAPAPEPEPVQPAAEPVKSAAAKPAATKRASKKPAAAKPATATLSINTASAAELAAVKGLPKAAAAAIVAARPFKRLDDLLAVKGIGEKLLDKLKCVLAL